MRALITFIAIALSGLVNGDALAQREHIHAYAESPTMWAAAVSQDGRRLATGCSHEGERAVCIYDLQRTDSPRLFPAPEDGRITRFEWVNDRHVVIYLTFLHRVGGWRSGSGVEYQIDRAISMNAATGNTAFLLNNQSSVTSLTDISSLNLSDPSSVIMGLSVRRATSQIGTRMAQPGVENLLFRVNLETGYGTTLAASRRPITVSQIMDAYGRVVATANYDSPADLYSIENLERETVFSYNPRGNWPNIFGTLEDGAALGMSFPSGPHAGLQRLDLETGALTPIAFRHEQMEEYGTILDPWTGDFVGLRGMTDGLPEQDFHDSELRATRGALTDALQGSVGPARITLVNWSQDRSVTLVEAREPATPSAYYLYDANQSSLGPLGTGSDGLLGLEMASVESFSYEASDGLTIPAYLVLPPGQSSADGPFPLIVMPHGGPAARDSVSFDFESQYYASLGYAVLKANFRGSDGYGIAFREAGYGEFGGRMIEDLRDGAQYLVDQGIAREGGYCAAGGSYGGYASLMLGLLDRANVRCIIATAAVTDPLDMLGDNHQAGQASAVRYWEQYIGPRLMGREAATQISPRRRAAEFRAPILLIHGSDDTTVPIGQSRALARELRDARLATFIELSGEDHYFTRTSSRLRLLEEATRMLDRHHPID